jgi:hypothetical protein
MSILPFFGGVIALMQVIIAWLAYSDSKYKSYGLPPIAVMTGIDQPHDAFANGRQPVVIKFELWNRQTYPIVLRKTLLVVPGFEPDDYQPMDDLLEMPWPALHSEIIAPGARGCFERKGTMPLFGLAPACAVHFGYYEPITNRIKEISGRRERETMDTVTTEYLFSVQYASPIGLLLYRLRERLSGVSSSLQSACQQALVGVRSLLSRLRIAVFKRTASPSGPTEAR